MNINELSKLSKLYIKKYTIRLRRKWLMFWRYMISSFTKLEVLLMCLCASLTVVSVMAIGAGTNFYESYIAKEYEYNVLESNYEDLEIDNQIVYDELELALETLDEYESENERMAEELNQIALAEKYRQSLISSSTYWTAKDLRSGKPRELIKLCAIEYGVDPILAVAISRLETGNWTSELCTESNNFGGIRTNSGPFATYKTRFEGINAFCKLLRTYKRRGYDTIDKMAKIYCPGTASSWAEKVKELYDEEK